jgi:hypothetical protein
MIDWPTTELDPVRRLRILAAGLPYVSLDEAVIDAPLERLWGLTGDLVSGVPRFERHVLSVEVLERDGDHLSIEARSHFGLRMRYDVELRLGWCLMRSPYSQIGMAAAPEGESGRTRFAHFEGSPVLGRLARPFFRWNIAGDLRRIARLLEAPPA